MERQYIEFYVFSGRPLRRIGCAELPPLHVPPLQYKAPFFWLLSFLRSPNIMSGLSLNVTDLIHTTSRSSGLSPMPSTPSPVSARSGESVGVPKEVAHELLDRERARHRKQGDVPYPIRYSSQNFNLCVPPLPAWSTSTHTRRTTLTALSPKTSLPRRHSAGESTRLGHL